MKSLCATLSRLHKSPYHRIEVEQLAPAPASDQRLLELWQLAAQREKQFLRLFRELSPEAAETAGLAPLTPLSLDTIRATLGSNQTIVEYFRVRDHILAALVSHAGLEIIHVTRAPQIAAMLRTLQFQLAKFRLGQSYVHQFNAPLLKTTQARLHGLYLELFAPIRQKIKGRELIIVPHELLQGQRLLSSCTLAGVSAIDVIRAVTVSAAEMLGW